MVLHDILNITYIQHWNNNIYLTKKGDKNTRFPIKLLWKLIELHIV